MGTSMLSNAVATPAPRTFDNVFALWARSGSLFLDGFDYILGVMLIAGIPAAAVALAVRASMASISSNVPGSLLSLLFGASASSLIFPWTGGAIVYGTAIRLQDGIVALSVERA